MGMNIQIGKERRYIKKCMREKGRGKGEKIRE